LSDYDFLSEDSYSSEEDEKVKCNKGDFTDLCHMGKSSRNASDSDSDVMDGGLKNKWLRDSGCSKTFVVDKKGKMLDTNIIKVNDYFTLNDVALVDDLRYNLLSVSQFTNADLDALFCKSGS
jgi:hypothetical protein